MDLKKIAGELVSRVEQTVRQEGGDTGATGKIDTAKEKSIFEQELGKMNISEADANAIWGLVTSESNSTSVKSAKAKSAKGEPIVINVNNQINWYINIKIDVDLSEELQKLIDQLMENQDKNFAALMAFLKENGAENTNIILAAIKELFNAYEASNDKDHAELMEVLNKLVAELEAQGVQIENLEKMVADLVQNSFEVMEMMGVELDAIKKALEESNKKQEEQIEIMAMINEAILQLTNKFDAHSEKTVSQLNDLLGMVGKNGVTLDDILAVLKAIKADTSEGCEIGKEVLELVKNLGFEFTEGISKVIEAINAKKDPDNVEVNIDISGLEALLKEILAEVKSNTEVDKAGFKAILDKLGEMGNNAGQVDLSTIEELLAEIKDLTKDNGDKLNGILTNQDTMIMLLENFKKDIDGRFDELLAQGKITQEQLNEILEKLDALIDKVGNNECNCDVDGAALMAKLQEIIDAIQDGSCQCEHSSEDSNDSNNESIITDLDKIFMSNKKDVTGIDNVQAGQSNGAKGKKFFGPDGNVYIRRDDGKVFDLSGREVNM